MPLLHNTNSSDIQWFSTHSNGTNEWHKEHWKAAAKDKMPTSVINHSLVLAHDHVQACLSEDIWILILIYTCLKHPSWEGMQPLLWFNLTWSRCVLQLFTIPENVAILQEQEFHVSVAVGSIAPIGATNVGHIPWPNEQLAVGQHCCVCWTSRSLQSADNMEGDQWIPYERFLIVQLRSSQGTDFTANELEVQGRTLPGCLTSELGWHNWWG
jgi:hypothetical protein